MKVDVEKLVSRIEEIYGCGAKEDGTHSRMAYSEEDIRARRLFAGYGRKLGMQTRMDEAGNLILRMEGKNETLPAIQLGSHLDTVPDGGKYDGVLGCLAGLGVCEAYIAAGEKSEHPIEVIVFTDEEGFRFGKGLLGSSAICGQDPDVYESETDIYGAPRSQVMENYGIKCSEIGKARRDPRDVLCFIELHIEQGATLDRKHIPIGVVTSIAGVSRYNITVTGETNHAPLPMTAWVKENIQKAVRELDYPYMELPSGAFHDSLIMSSVFPTGMIFVPSVNGVSHSRYELTRTEDIEMGCDVLLKAVRNINKLSK